MFVAACQPYPTNPSFRPPAPISDSVKERIYQIYFHSSPGASSASKPATPPPTIAQISEAFSIGKKRVEAILRLKLLEKEWEHKDKVSVARMILYPGSSSRVVPSLALVDRPRFEASPPPHNQ